MAGQRAARSIAKNSFCGQKRGLLCST
jgi:hypothetical protein